MITEKGSLTALAAALKAVGLEAELREEGLPSFVKTWHPAFPPVGLCVITDHVPPVGTRWFRSAGDGYWFGPCEDVSRIAAEIKRIFDGLLPPDGSGEGS